ncbi:MAG: hypothetical protein ACLQU5_19280 [Isosphaeraceae bacterium]
MLAGYHGRYVRVDAATGTLSSEALALEILRRFVGGVGLGTWILANASISARAGPPAKTPCRLVP